MNNDLMYKKKFKKCSQLKYEPSISKFKCMERLRMTHKTETPSDICRVPTELFSDLNVGQDNFHDQRNLNLVCNQRKFGTTGAGSKC